MKTHLVSASWGEFFLRGTEHVSVGSMLSDLLSQASESKNYIIKETGIDRSTFYQILRGNRIATEDHLKAICKHVPLDAATYEELVDCYERERVDEKTYEQRQQVKRFFHSLSKDVPVIKKTKESELISDFIVQETAAGNECYRLFLPSGSRRTTELFWAIENTISATGKVPDIRQLVAEEGGRRSGSGTSSMFLRMAEWFSYLKDQTMRFHAYSLGKIMTGLNTIAFPYYIVGEKTMLLISYSERQVVMVHDQSIVNAYRNNFDKVMKDAVEIASTDTDYASIMQFFVRHWMTIGKEPVYLLTPRPCLWLCSTDELVAKYLQNDEFIQYGQMYRNLNVREFTTQTGLENFRKNAKIQEAGMNLKIDAEDMRRIRRMLSEHRDRISFVLNEDRVHVPEEWQMFLIGRQVVAFVPYDRTNYMICFTSKEIIDPLADWFESRVKTLNNDIIRKKERTLLGGVTETNRRNSEKKRLELTNSGTECDNLS